MIDRMIVTSDWHLRDSVPKCLALTQTEWYELQEDMLNQIVSKCIETESDLYVVGDIFDNDKDCSHKLIQMVQTSAKLLESSNHKFNFIAGNHDEKYHDSDLSNSAIGILMNSENCYLLVNDHSQNIGASNFGGDPSDESFVFIHTLTMREEDVNKYVECETPQSLAKRFPHAKYIFCGDYHKFFIEQVESDGELINVVNCGCTLIEKADFVDYEPRIVYVDVEKDYAEAVYLKTDTYKFCKTEMKEDSEVLEELTSKLSKEQMTLDYQSNLEKAIMSEPKDVQDKIRGWM